MLPERYASAVLWTTKVREVCTQMDEPHAGEQLGEEGCGQGFHLQYQAHKTPGTCKTQIKEKWRERDRVRTNSAIQNTEVKCYAGVTAESPRL